MTLHSLTPPRTMLAILCGIGLAAGIATSPARADQWNKKTILTVNETVQVTDTVLQPGQYVLKLLDSPSERHVVQIFNSDQSHIINTVVAIPSERLRPTGHTALSFWETPPGNVRALRTWYYPGDNFGQEFPYPKHLRQVAMLLPLELPPLVAEAAPVEANPEPAPAEPAAAPPAQSEATPPEPAPEQPAEVAQNTTPAETPAQPAPEQPAELPKTGSPYAAIGIAGALAIGLAGLLRIKRTA